MFKSWVYKLWFYLLLLFRVRLGDGSNAPSLGGLSLDGSPVPLGSTAAHEPTGISKIPVGKVEVPRCNK